MVKRLSDNRLNYPRPTEGAPPAGYFHCISWIIVTSRSFEPYARFLPNPASDMSPIAADPGDARVESTAWHPLRPAFRR